jgi:hypothetical protein
VDPVFLAFTAGELIDPVGDGDRHLRHGRYSLLIAPLFGD